MTQLIEQLQMRLSLLPQREQNRILKRLLSELSEPHESSSDQAYWPTWEEIPPAERMANLDTWMASLPKGPGLPEEAMHRDSMYD